MVTVPKPLISYVLLPAAILFLFYMVSLALNTQTNKYTKLLCCCSRALVLPCLGRSLFLTQNLDFSEILPLL